MPRPRWTRAGEACSRGSPTTWPQLTAEPDTLAQAQDRAVFLPESLSLPPFLLPRNFKRFYFSESRDEEKETRGSSIPLTASSLPASRQPLPTQTAPPWAPTPFLLCLSALSACGLEPVPPPSRSHLNSSPVSPDLHLPPLSPLLPIAVLCPSLLHAQLCLTPGNLLDRSPPASSAHGIFPARILEWVAISRSKEVFPTQGWSPRLLQCRHWQVDSFPRSHLGRLSLWP